MHSPRAFRGGTHHGPGVSRRVRGLWKKCTDSDEMQQALQTVAHRRCRYATRADPGLHAGCFRDLMRNVEIIISLSGKFLST